MWTETPLEQLRAALLPLLPPRAFLRRDRGDMLLVTNAPVFDESMDAIPGFIVERRGNLLHILPDALWLARFEQAAPPDDLCASLLRFKGQIPDLENLKLFAMGAKLLEGGTAAELQAYDRALRNRAALALRGGCGGGLYAAALLNYAISNTNKEDNP